MFEFGNTSKLSPLHYLISYSTTEKKPLSDDTCQNVTIKSPGCYQQKKNSELIKSTQVCFPGAQSLLQSSSCADHRAAVDIHCGPVSVPARMTGGRPPALLEDATSFSSPSKMKLSKIKVLVTGTVQYRDFSKRFFRYTVKKIFLQQRQSSSNLLFRLACFAFDWCITFQCLLYQI